MKYKALRMSIRECTNVHDRMRTSKTTQDFAIIGIVYTKTFGKFVMHAYLRTN